MAAGAPVVATRVGGTPEAIADGENGLLVPPADIASLAGAVTSLLEAPALAARLGRAAKQSITDRFSVERMAEMTERLYSHLLARAASTPGRRRFGRRPFGTQEDTWSQEPLR
jgi:glycosyltransferase involved in cell wall biosynthesis